MHFGGKSDANLEIFAFSHSLITFRLDIAAVTDVVDDPSSTLHVRSHPSRGAESENALTDKPLGVENGATDCKNAELPNPSRNRRKYLENENSNLSAQSRNPC
ncbi:Hypothetical protein NTJ_13996 [Nesidiocoris tenuis]|uniref:Uncharacterized protein n=1 Tax=Nesidiocoris tenuis TaxID=355587 RepID=A0ABN7BBH2_9HEMI|nr:Hypothetical protein NTJ_13996 [Nesidiocoris tenuis]